MTFPSTKNSPLPAWTLAVALLTAPALPTHAQTLPAELPTREDLARDNKLFVTLASRFLKWEEPAEPARIAGPIYFVGTKGLGVFLFATTEGHILMNTGMPSSGPMIADSIRKLGFRVEDIRVMINGHAHADHAGAFAELKRLAPKAQLAVMKDDVAAMESGGRGDFKYGDDLAFPPARVDRVLRDGDTVRLGEVLLTAYHTPGHTRGATTWIAHLVVEGKPCVVAFPDGAGFNPGYRLTGDVSYPGIAEDYRRTHHFLEMLKPDIWLAQHNEYYDLHGKLQRVRTEGVKAWMDPEGYRRFIAGKKRAFEDEIDPAAAAKAREKPARAAKAATPGAIPVTVHNFNRAETDRYMGELARDVGIGTIRHARDFAPIDKQVVVRMNRDTLYSSAVFDLDAAPVTIELPAAGNRYMALQAVNQDHYVVEVAHAPTRRTFTRQAAGTRYLYVIVRTLANAADPADVREANRLQDAIRIEQARRGSFEVPAWDTASLDKAREALSELGALGGVVNRFGTREQVNPLDHAIGTAIGWGGNPRAEADYQSFQPPVNDGKTAYRLRVKDVPVDGFWSITVYDAKGFMVKNDAGLYSLNNLVAKPDPDGGYTIQFGGDPKAAPNYLPIMPGWNYTVRLYRPRKEILEGKWVFPAARQVQ
jgi:metallo-beta-lactamase class B